MKSCQERPHLWNSSITDTFSHANCSIFALKRFLSTFSIHSLLLGTFFTVAWLTQTAVWSAQPSATFCYGRHMVDHNEEHISVDCISIRKFSFKEMPFKTQIFAKWPSLCLGLNVIFFLETYPKPMLCWYVQDNYTHKIVSHPTPTNIPHPHPTLTTRKPWHWPNCPEITWAPQDNQNCMQVHVHISTDSLLHRVASILSYYARKFN